jgi:hypothetical protein
MLSATAQFNKKDMYLQRNMAAPSDFCIIESSQLVIPFALHSTAIKFVLFTVVYVTQSYYYYYYILFYSFEKRKRRGHKFAKCDY